MYKIIGINYRTVRLFGVIWFIYLIIMQGISKVQVITRKFAGKNFNIIEHALLLGKTSDFPEEFSNIQQIMRLNCKKHFCSWRENISGDSI